MTQMFEFRELDLKGAYVITPFISTDERGSFIKDYNVNAFMSAGIRHDLKETFYTVSKRGVIRAIHFQLDKPQAKLMRCISGKVYYALVDLRPSSPTCGRTITMELSGDAPLSVLVPEGFGQGYLVLEDSVMSYKASEVFYSTGDSGIIYNDPDIGIVWPFEKIGGKNNLIISDKDLGLMSYKEYLIMMKKLGEENDS